MGFGGQRAVAAPDAVSRLSAQQSHDLYCALRHLADDPTSLPARMRAQDLTSEYEAWFPASAVPPREVLNALPSDSRATAYHSAPAPTRARRAMGLALRIATVILALAVAMCIRVGIDLMFGFRGGAY